MTNIIPFPFSFVLNNRLDSRFFPATRSSSSDAAGGRHVLLIISKRMHGGSEPLEDVGVHTYYVYNMRLRDTARRCSWRTGTGVP